MAAYTVALSKHATLVANTIDTVGFSTQYSSAEVLNRSAFDIYMLPTETPTLVGAANDTYIIPAGQAMTIGIAHFDADAVIQLISTGAAAYSVTGVDR